MQEIKARIKLVNAAHPRAVALLSSRRIKAPVIEVEGLVDTGAVCDLVIPKKLSAKLGLKKIDETEVGYGNGQWEKRTIVGPLLVELLGRKVVCEAIAEPSLSKILIGEILLEKADVVPHPQTGSLLPNPDHPHWPEVHIYTLKQWIFNCLPLPFGERVGSKIRRRRSEGLPKTENSFSLGILIGTRGLETGLANP